MYLLLLRLSFAAKAAIQTGSGQKTKQPHPLLPISNDKEDRWALVPSVNLRDAGGHSRI